METKDIYELTIKRLYTKPQRLTQKDLENARSKTDESIIIKAHYEMCLRLAKYARENELNKADFEDLLSDAYIHVYDFVTKHNKSKTKDVFLDALEIYVIENIKVSDTEKKKKNMDLNYKKRVGMNVLETEVPNFSVLTEDHIALKMDTQAALNRTQKNCEGMFDCDDKKIIESEYGIDGTVPKLCEATAQANGVDVEQVYDVNRIYGNNLRRQLKSYDTSKSRTK